MRVLEQLEIESLVYPGQRYPYRIVEFSDFDPRDKLRALRELITFGCNPAMQELASTICNNAGAPPKDTRAEAAALLAFVQAIPYRSKSPETFRTADYTVRAGYGDCPQKTVLFCTLCESIGIPTEAFALGKRQGLFTFDWFHAYAKVGYPARAPVQWIPAETTLNVPLGWDPEQWAQRVANAGHVL